MEKKRLLNPVRDGIKWAVKINFIIVLFIVTVNLVDILQSQRRGYNDFNWSNIHSFAITLMRYGLLGSHPSRTAILGLASQCFVFTILIYFLSQRIFSLLAARRKFVITFAISFLLANYAVTFIAAFILFFISVLKFGFV